MFQGGLFGNVLHVSVILVLLGYIRVICIMARSLSNMLLRNISSFRAARLSCQISGSLYQSGMNYSTTLSNDPDTH